MTTLRSLFIITAICISCLLSACSKDDLRSTVDPTLPATPTPDPDPVVDTSAPSFRQMLGTYKGTWQIKSTSTNGDPAMNYDNTTECILEVKRVSGTTLQLILDGRHKADLIYDSTGQYIDSPSPDNSTKIMFRGDSALYQHFYHVNIGPNGGLQQSQWEIGKWKKIKKGL